MNDLLKTELFSLLAESSLATAKQMQQAYETFVKEVETLNQSEVDYPTIFRSLNLTRIEFRTLQAHFLCEQGKKYA